MNKLNIENRRYLGSKTRLIPFIKKVINEECEGITSFADLFAGTGTVGWNFNDSNTEVILNDILFSNYVSYISWFGKEKINKTKIEKYLKKYNDTKTNEDNYFSINFSGTYFSKDNCRKIGFIRENIEQEYLKKNLNKREYSILITSLLYSVDRIANTVGHYDAYRLKGDLNRPLIMENLNIADNKTNDNNSIYSENANELVKKIKADITYIDPPYNSRQYCDAYHLLENIAKWDKPKVFGVAKKMDRSNIKSRYCTQSATLEFEELIKNINSKYILVSYNNMGKKGSPRSQSKIEDEDLIRILSTRGKVKVFEKNFNQFTTGKTKIEKHKERLFLCQVGKKSTKIKVKQKELGLVKSPLNYTGGKYKLLPQLIDKFPKDFNTFIDLFAGGFNVGANIECEDIIYNDSQNEVKRIVKLFQRYNYAKIVGKIDQIIYKYNLSNTILYGYDYYNCMSDSGLGSYNKEKYMKLRNDYNSTSHQSVEKDFLLLTLIIFAFNNQIRFNSKNEYNMPVGKRDFNSSSRRNLKHFAKKIHEKKVSFLNEDFTNIDISKYEKPFVYCDPPYLLGVASYNENHGWNVIKEKELLDYLKKIDDLGIHFALSNVIEHKGKTNDLLKEWVDENHFNIIYIKSNYRNSNYHIKNKDSVTREVLVTNY